MKSFITDAAGSVVGVGAEDGTSHLASQTILAAGGWIDSLLDTKGQLLAKGSGDVLPPVPSINTETISCLIQVVLRAHQVD